MVSSAVQTVFDGLASLFGLPFTGWADLTGASWVTAAESVATFGLGAWIVAVVVIAAFFLLVWRTVETYVTGVLP